MKTLIFGFFVIICMQITFANRSNECKNDLSKLRKAATKFFDEFEKEHNSSRDIVKQIEIICNAILDALKTFTTKDYGTRLSSKQIQNDVQEFTKRFFEQRLDVLNFLHRLGNKIDVLLEMADCFTYSYNLPCEEHCTGTGCEADLNKVRCKLADFFKVLIRIGKEAKDDVQGVEYECNILGEQTRIFRGKHHLECASCDVKDSHLLSSVRKFFHEFDVVYMKAQKKMEHLANICKELANTIDDWQKKLK